MPSLIVEYILVDEELYDVSGGLGGGYHVGVLNLKYSTIDDSYAANGVGMVMMLNGNTALGEDLFVHLAVSARWNFWANSAMPMTGLLAREPGEIP